MATFLDSTLQGLSSISSALNGTNPATQQQIASYQANGFLLASTPSATGSGLPFSKITPQVNGQIQRNIITWFVPQFGTVQMFINPQNISYNHKKLITKDRTKGGYTLQYWGEDLSTLNISGTTGSSGIEGINMLYEIYRAEQYAFDAVGLTMAANNSAADISNNLSTAIGGAVGQLIGGTPFASGANSAGLLGGILGLDSPNNTLSARNIPTLASLAFAVEMYYNGWVYRGFFENMTINERADNFLLDYSMVFTVTQRRGYRTNYFPWQENPSAGHTTYGLGNGGSANGNAYSFNGQTIVNTNQGVNVNNTTTGTGVLNTLISLL
jgi:hypothetical protein